MKFCKKKETNNFTYIFIASSPSNRSSILRKMERIKIVMPEILLLIYHHSHLSNPGMCWALQVDFSNLVESFLFLDDLKFQCCLRMIVELVKSEGEIWAKRFSRVMAQNEMCWGSSEWSREEAGRWSVHRRRWSTFCPCSASDWRKGFTYLYLWPWQVALLPSSDIRVEKRSGSHCKVKASMEILKLQALHLCTQIERLISFYCILLKNAVCSFLKGHNIFHRVILPPSQKKLLSKLNCFCLSILVWIIFCI